MSQYQEAIQALDSIRCPACKGAGYNFVSGQVCQKCKGTGIHPDPSPHVTDAMIQYTLKFTIVCASYRRVLNTLKGMQ